MDRRTVFLSAFLGLVPRLYFAAQAPTNDVIQLGHSAVIFATGGNIYTQQYYFNYTPAIGLPLALIDHLQPFAIWWHVFLMGVSLANGLLLIRLNNPRAFILYWLNPAIILFDSYTGQFETVAMLFLLIALIDEHQTFGGGTLSLIVKHVTLPLTWALFVYRKGVRRAAWWLVTALALFVATFIPYLPGGAPDIAQRVFLYGSWNNYGFGNPLLFFAMIALLPMLARALQFDLIDGLLFCALGQVVFMYGFGSNNIYPALLIASIRPTRWLIPLSAAYVLLVSPWTQLETNPPNTNNVFFVIAGLWLVAQIATRQRLPDCTNVRLYGTRVLKGT